MHAVSAGGVRSHRAMRASGADANAVYPDAAMAPRPPRDIAHLQTEQRLRSLMLAGLEGDAAAYRQFLQQMATRLRSFYRRRLSGWPDDVEDLVQDTLLALHNQRHTYQRTQPLTAWVHAIARYKTIDLLRARQAREALHDPWTTMKPASSITPRTRPPRPGAISGDCSPHCPTASACPSSRSSCMAARSPTWPWKPA